MLQLPYRMRQMRRHFHTPVLLGAQNHQIKVTQGTDQLGSVWEHYWLKLNELPQTKSILKKYVLFFHFWSSSFNRCTYVIRGIQWQQKMYVNWGEYNLLTLIYRHSWAYRSAVQNNWLSSSLQQTYLLKHN